MNQEEQTKVNHEFSEKASSMSEEDLQRVTGKQEKVFSLLKKL